MTNGLIVVAKLDNGDEFFLISHDEGISISTKKNDEKVIMVESFSDTAIVVKMK